MIAVEHRRRAAILLSTSFLVASVAGGLAVFYFWQSRGAPDIAIARLIIFVALMAAVHGIGGALFCAQGEGASVQESRGSPALRKSMQIAVVQYVVFLALTALILDGGFVFRCFLSGVLIHAAIMGIVCSRRSACPSNVDILLLRYGYLPLAMLAVQATTVLVQWSAR